MRPPGPGPPGTRARARGGTTSGLLVGPPATLSQTAVSSSSGDAETATSASNTVSTEFFHDSSRASRSPCCCRSARTPPPRCGPPSQPPRRPTPHRFPVRRRGRPPRRAGATGSPPFVPSWVFSHGLLGERRCRATYIYWDRYSNGRPVSPVAGPRTRHADTQGTKRRTMTAFDPQHDREYALYRREVGPEPGLGVRSR